MDVITNKISKIFCIYFPFAKNNTKFFPRVEAEKIKSCYSLKQLPNVNPDNVYEYNAEIMQQNEILNDIIKKISNLREEHETV